MADAARVKSSAPPQPSRLQRRRPASLQISPASSNCWNAAIPLLSPLATSPTAVDFKSRDELIQQHHHHQQHQRSSSVNNNNNNQEPLVFKKWQHPAAPFCYDSAAFAPSFFVNV